MSTAGPTSHAAKCPTNSYLVGGGFGITGGANQVTASFGNPSTGYWIAGVTEAISPGTTLTVYAQCLTKSIVKQITLSSGKKSSSLSPISAAATCPAGTYVIGGGFLNSSPYENSMIYGSLLDVAHNQWSARASYVKAGPYTLYAYGICLTL